MENRDWLIDCYLANHQLVSQTSVASFDIILLAIYIIHLKLDIDFVKNKFGLLN